MTDKSSSAEAIEKFRQIIIHPAEPPPTDDDRSLSDQVVTKAESEIITSRNNKEHREVKPDFAKLDPHQSDFKSDLPVTSVDSQNLLCNTLVNVSSDQTESLSSATTKKESTSESFQTANSSSQSKVKNWKSKAGSALKTGAVAVGAIAASPILLPALGASALAAKVKGATKGKYTKVNTDAEEEDFTPEDLNEGVAPVVTEYRFDTLEVQTSTPLRSKDTPVNEGSSEPDSTSFAPVEKGVSELAPETPVISTSESDLVNTQKEIQSEKTSDLTPVAQEIRSDCAPATAIEDQPDFAPALNQENSADEVDFVRTVDPIEEEPAQLTPPNPTKFAPVDEFTPLTTDQPTKSTTESTSELTPEDESAPVTETITVIEKGYTFDDLVHPEDKLDQELESQEGASKEPAPVSREETPAQDLSIVDLKKVAPEIQEVVPEKSAPEIQKVCPEAQNVAPVQAISKSGANQAPKNLNSETVSDHQKSIWDKAAEIDIPSEVHLSFEEESEDLTSSPTHPQKINDQPISKVGVNSPKLSKDSEIEQPTEQKEEEKENQVSSSSSLRLDYQVTKEEETANFEACKVTPDAPQFHQTTKEAQVYEDACLIKHSIDTESFQAETQESSWKSTAGAVLKTGALAVGAVAGAAFVLPALGASAVAGSIATAGAGAASVSATSFATATAAAATTAAATAVAVKSAATGGSEEITEITESAEQTEIDEVKGQENRQDNRLISSSEA